MSLQLEYAFVPSPNPIRASVPGANPNTIDLLVTMNPPGAYPVTLTQIDITIPVGDDTLPGDLSAAASLPQPTEVAGASGWAVSVSGSTVTLLGSQDGTGISSPISFVLPGIAVNEVSGTVPLTVTEHPVDGGKVMDGTTYTLFKQAADFPVSNFWAAPPRLTDLDQTVTLYWQCTGQGETLVYSVSAGDWNPADCLNGGTCLSCADGSTGVATPPLSQTTTFTLDVIRTDGTDRVIADTLTLTVPVLVPSISQNSYVRPVNAAGGRYVSLHWLAYNAAYCSVLVGTETVVENAPADTYADGYLLYLPDAGTYEISVVAHAAQGDAIATLQLGAWAVSASRQVGTSLPPTGIAASTGGAQALLACTDGKQFAPSSSYIGVLQLPGGETAATYPTLLPGAVALSPDGNVGVVLVPPLITLVWVFMTYVQPIGTVDSPMNCAAFTPAGDLLLVGCSDGTLRSVELGVSNFDNSVPVGGAPGAVAAASPAGGASLAIVAVPSASQVVFVDLDTFQVDGPALAVSGPGALAVSPDGSLALVALPGAGAVAVIDVAGRALESATIPTGGAPSSIAFSPDGVLAFVADGHGSTVTAIQVATRSVIGAPLSLPGQPVGLAVGGAEGTLLVACANDTVVLF